MEQLSIILLRGRGLKKCLLAPAPCGHALDRSQMRGIKKEVKARWGTGYALTKEKALRYHFHQVIKIKNHQ